MTKTFGWLGVGLAAALAGCAHEQPKMVAVDEYQQEIARTPEQQPAAQSQQQQQFAQPQQAMLPRGTQLLVKLEQPLGDSATGGQRFVATLVQPVTDAGGATVLPVGCKVFGHVGAVQEGTEERPASITLAIDSVSVDGFERPLHARIVGTDPGAPQHGVNPTFITAESAEGELGAVIGGDQRQQVGGGLGAPSSTTISLGLPADENALPSGTVMAVQLLEPIAIDSLKPYRG